MNALRSWLTHLTRAEVSELVLASDRRPSVKVSGAFQPVDPAALSTDDILMLLMALGGSRFVDALGPKPVQWTIRVEAVGVIAVLAARQGELVQVRLSRAPVGSAAGTRPSQQLSVKHLEEGPRASPSPSASDRPPAARPPASDRPPAARLPPSDRPPAARPSPSDRAPPAAHPPPSDRRPAAAAAAPAPAPRGKASVHGMPSSFLDGLLLTAREERASDLHIVAGRPPLLRIAGELLPRGEPLSREAVEGLLLPRIPPRLAPTLAAEGSCDFALELGAVGRFRVNVSRQRTGYKGSFRLIAQDIPTLASLGLPDAIGLATRHHQGLIVITGPTGHGKTTTLAAVVNILNRETGHHIITVEDPVEFLHPRGKAMISQREVGTHTRSFESALKASLREDPDVIVVGELRDTATVRMALSASETGHLVLGTMNTPSAAKTIDRLIDLFPPGDQQQVRVTLAGGLRLIVSQRLLPSVDLKGMVAAAEILPGSVALWNLIRDSKTFQIPSLQQRGKSLGIVRLDDSLAELVRAGKTTLEAALAVAEAPDELEATLTGRRPQATPPGAPGRPAAPAVPGPEAAKPAPNDGPGKGLLGRAGALFGKKGG